MDDMIPCGFMPEISYRAEEGAKTVAEVIPNFTLHLAFLPNLSIVAMTFFRVSFLFFSFCDQLIRVRSGETVDVVRACSVGERVLRPDCAPFILRQIGPQCQYHPKLENDTSRTHEAQIAVSHD
jgi:hypothetical protein